MFDTRRKTTVAGRFALPRWTASQGNPNAGLVSTSSLDVSPGYRGNLHTALQSPRMKVVLCLCTPRMAVAGKGTGRVYTSHIHYHLMYRSHQGTTEIPRHILDRNPPQRAGPKPGPFASSNLESSLGYRHESARAFRNTYPPI